MFPLPFIKCDTLRRYIYIYIYNQVYLYIYAYNATVFYAEKYREVVLSELVGSPWLAMVQWWRDGLRSGGGGGLCKGGGLRVVSRREFF